MVMEVFGKEKFTGNDLLLLGPSVIYTVMLFCIGWLGNRQRAVLLTDIEDESVIAMAIAYKDMGQDTGFPLPAKSQKSQKTRIKNRLEKLFNDKQIYLNKDLTIWTLAKQLNTNRTYLSQLINADYGQNFSTFVNSYRVRHAENLQKFQPELSESEIAEMSGFGNVKSWKRARKK